jgi:DNA polymerase III delta prime subunit
MALKGKKPTTIEKRMKALFYGPAGVGKTTAAIQFPKPYLIDTERGAENDQYVKLLNAAGGAYMFTTDADELIAEVVALLSENHPYQTLVIDPLTVVYNDLLDRAAEKEGTEFGRHKIPADRKIKHLLTLLLRVDMNVVITSHAKPNWVRSKDAKGKDIAVQEGMTFDCYGRLDYLFDLVFEVGKRGKDRIGTVRKTRVEGFPEGDIFPFCYNEIADRYGRNILERNAVPIVLATPEQIEELNAMLEHRVDKDALIAKWLDRAEADNLHEMTKDQISKCLDYLKKGTK